MLLGDGWRYPVCDTQGTTKVVYSYRKPTNDVISRALLSHALRVEAVQTSAGKPAD